METIAEDYKKAFRGGDKAVTEVLRVLKSGLMNEEIAKRGKSGEREVALTDAEVLSVVKRQVKQLEEAGELFAQGGRADLKEKNDAELVILKKYMPARMDERKVREVVKAVVTRMGTSGPADFGKVMGAAMKEFGGKAEGTVVSRVVKELLGG